MPFSGYTVFCFCLGAYFLGFVTLWFEQGESEYRSSGCCNTAARSLAAMSDTNSERRIVVSVVSHGQGQLVARLLEDLSVLCDHSKLRVIVTVNIPEPLPFASNSLPFPLLLVQNASPKGFGANHNAAFKTMEGDVFCVLNPDIRLTEDPFPVLLKGLDETQAGLVAPLIVNPLGLPGSNARCMINPFRILRRIFRRIFKLEKRLDYEIGTSLIAPDWIGGMFMLFSSRPFADVGGFDERYYMYCEDADICARLHNRGHGIWLIPVIRVIHHARAASHRNIRHLWWHIASLARFFILHRNWHRAARTIAKVGAE